MEFMLAAQIIAGLWCKWRHGKQWTYGSARVYPVQRCILTPYHCPKCGDGTLRKPLSREEADKWLEVLTARPKPVPLGLGLSRLLEMQDVINEVDRLVSEQIQRTAPYDEEGLRRHIAQAEVDSMEWPDNFDAMPD